MAEFSIIQQYFAARSLQRDDVLLGIGDDAAVVQIPEHSQLVTAIDTLVAGTHFFHDCPAMDIGHKALAVNLSDMAAMGAQPAYFTLALTMPEVNNEWLEQFSQGLFALAAQYGLQLIGGDTTRGPLSITIQVIGYVEHKQYLTRCGAKVNDVIYVTGRLGLAGLALKHFREQAHLLLAADQAEVIGAMQRPQPRIQAALTAKTYINAAIDISDGLAADLGHILQQSNVGACIKLANLPIAQRLYHYLSPAQAQEMALYQGDDYELIFTVAEEQQKAFLQAIAKTDTRVTAIGRIEETPNLRGQTADGEIHPLSQLGFEHF